MKLYIILITFIQTIEKTLEFMTFCWQACSQDPKSTWTIKKSNVSDPKQDFQVQHPADKYWQFELAHCNLPQTKRDAIPLSIFV